MVAVRCVVQRLESDLTDNRVRHENHVRDQVDNGRDTNSSLYLFLLYINVFTT